MRHFSLLHPCTRPSAQLLSVLATALVAVFSCGPSAEEQQRLSREETLRLEREDSAALKVGVLPTLDALPLFIAQERGWYEEMGADVRLKPYQAQMDCDTAIAGRAVEGIVSDLVRAERLRHQGVELTYVTATNAYWQLYGGRTARILQAKQLDDKMMAMTRYSATDLLGDAVVDSAGLKPERVFRIQVNDVNVRLQMLQTNTMDALWLTEPQATQARQLKATLLADSRRHHVALGVLAFRADAVADTLRRQQLDVLRQAWDRAVDSLSAHGLAPYADVIEKWTHLKASLTDSLPSDLTFTHVAPPAASDIERASAWLKKKSQ